MEMVRKYKWVIFTVFPILILIIARSFGTNHFKSDAEKWAEPTVFQTNILTIQQAETLQGEKLVIFLENNQNSAGISGMKSLFIPVDSLLTKNNLKLFKGHKGPLLINSSEKATTARIWMVLSQMGIKNIFIISDNTSDEVMKHKFRPDTLARPE